MLRESFVHKVQGKVSKVSRVKLNNKSGLSGRRNTERGVLERM